MSGIDVTKLPLRAHAEPPETDYSRWGRFLYWLRNRGEPKLSGQARPELGQARGAWPTIPLP